MPRSEVQIEDISKSYTNAREGIQYAIGIVNATLAKARYATRRGETRAYLEMRRDMPCFIHDTEEPSTQIVLNRYYKPLGFAGTRLEDWVKYEDWPKMHVHLTRDQIACVVSPGYERGLFGDENPPWAGRREAHAYVLQLEKLVAML